MLIPCSERCIYEEEGLCTLKTVTPPSNTPTRDCPYYKEKKGKVENSMMENFKGPP